MPQTIIITGASDGIGAAAARQLTARGERVILVGRSPEKTRAVAKELNAPYHIADYTDLSQVRRLADELRAAYPRIDVLANNAGGLFKKEITRDGFDKMIQVNHFGGFMLTHLLLDRLVESKAKVIQTSSVGAKAMGTLDVDSFNGQSSRLFLLTYGDTKLMNQLFTRELDRRYGDRGISAVSFHPGNIISSFGDRSYGFLRWIYATPVRLTLEKPEDGGARLAWLAEGTPGQTWQPGEYYERNQLAPASKVNPLVRDPEIARKLWDRTEQLLGLSAAI